MSRRSFQSLRVLVELQKLPNSRPHHQWQRSVISAPQFALGECSSTLRDVPGIERNRYSSRRHAKVVGRCYNVPDRRPILCRVMVALKLMKCLFCEIEAQFSRRAARAFDVRLLSYS